MNIEQTLCIIKPDATKRNITGAINKLIEESNLEILAIKSIYISYAQAAEFYAEHKGKSFFNDLANYISSDRIIIQIIQGKNAIMKFRDIIGATNPKEAKDGTIRKLFGISIDQNTIHGSDSTESARREINFFFPTCDIIQLSKIVQ